ncbi:hypothetical protein Dsin_008951 [Dipteronia sinensis]|uniref:Reverse transcriptase zinc-binding domain-containing protein n=1 Tax=Dipteronia sinensis TaxID=43782 RepID=A0AAE0APN3_9ROSI|nr:hypothetical protein Dsin_008951 [Dipteronia sinensis]
MCQTASCFLVNAYNGLFDLKDNPMWNWKFIWKHKIPQRIQHFFWILLHGKTLTNLQRVTRGLDSNSLCPRCESVVEDTAHLLRECKTSMAIWDSVFRGVTLFAAVDGDLENWFMKNLKNESMAFDKVPFCLLFAAVVWFIWKWRWGVERSFEEWLKGFALNRGVGSALEAELWGLFEGFTMAWYTGFRRIIVETDSLSAVHLLSKDLPVNHPLFGIAADCSALMAANWNCVLKHIYREGNRLADALAHLGQELAHPTPTPRLK